MENNKILEKIETNFQIKFDTSQDAEIIYNSISPEIELENNNRSRTTITLNDNIICININSEDVVSLRASINSYVRWIKLSMEILKI